MNIFHLRSVMTAGLASVAISMMAPAWAQQPLGTEVVEAIPPVSANESSWGLGVGFGYERKPYRDFDNKPQGLPLILYTNQYVSILGPSIDVHLPSAGPVSLRLRARYSQDGYEAEDSPYLVGMAERKDGFWVGGAAIWRAGFANLSAEILADAAGNSKGTKLKLQIDRRFGYGPLAFTPRLAAQRFDDNYVDYYYGVLSGEARPDRAGYVGLASTNIEAGVRIDYTIARRQNIFVDVSGNHLGSGIRDSPLVDRSNSSAVRFGYLYRF